uniref:Uncharacterized protein n=1 Tax=Zooxanthella nutricula TaxID=1333877 RepID=A0A7S2PE65_9DINO|mmetsp:Transcript_54631/g.166023  ORF Transcript_54631/g.166023 Transcript_54631/m.166023 type:complete len:411 (+) Transcript_54631:3-1235(+)
MARHGEYRPSFGRAAAAGCMRDLRGPRGARDIRGGLAAPPFGEEWGPPRRRAEADQSWQSWSRNEGWQGAEEADEEGHSWRRGRQERRLDGSGGQAPPLRQPPKQQRWIPSSRRDGEVAAPAKPRGQPSPRWASQDSDDSEGEAEAWGEDWGEDWGEEDWGEEWEGAEEAKRPASRLVRRATHGWEAAVRFRDDGESLKILMAGQSMGDADAGSWSIWFRKYMDPYVDWEKGYVAQEVDFSRNRLTSVGVRRILNALWHANVSVRVLKMHHNQLETGDDIAELIAEGSLREVHLSHNQLSSEGGADLVLAAAAARGEEGEYLYPSEGTGCAARSPLWLRLEQNRIDYAVFESRLKNGMKRLRRRDRLLCHVDGTRGCTPQTCMVRADPPIVHMPYLICKRTRDAAGPAEW